MSKKLERLESRIKPFREEIDAIDEVIVTLLNKRAIAATQIGHVKREYNVAVYAPKREEEVIGHVTGKNPGPLSNAAISRLFERIIDESRRLERETTLIK